MELSFGEMIVIVLAIIVVLGKDKIPEIARGWGQGNKKMKGGMEDVKSEIMKDADNPVSEIKKEIEKVKKTAQEYDPTEKIKQELDLRKQLDLNTSDSKNVTVEKTDQLSDNYNGPVSR